MEVKSKLLNLKKKAYFKLEDAGMVCKYHPNELNKIIVGDCRGNIYLFDTLIHEEKMTKNLLMKFKQNIHDYIIYDLDIDKDGKKLLIGTSGQVVCLFDLEREKILNVFNDHRNSVKVVNFNKKNENFFLSGGRDGKLYFYDIRENPDSKKILVHDAINERITGCDFFEDEKMIISSQTNSADCSIFDLKKLCVYTIKKKNKKNTPQNSLIWAFNPKTHLSCQLKFLSKQVSFLSECSNMGYKNLMKDYNQLKNMYITNENFTKAKTLKGITSLLVKEEDFKIINSDINNDIFLYNVNSLGYEEPVKLNGFWSPSTNVQITANFEINSVAVGGAQNIYFWELNGNNSLNCNIFERAHDLEINYLEFAISPSNNLCSVSDDGFCYVWEFPIVK
jgi:WD40 repeat protein